LGAYHTRHAQLAAWTGLGTFSTLSHGIFALISVPMWLFAGVTAAEYERHASLHHYPDVPLTDFRPFARFPQGRPAGVEAKSLGRLRSATAQEALSENRSAPAPSPSPPPTEQAKTVLHPTASPVIGQTVKLRASAVLRSQPKAASNAEPAGVATQVALKASMRNADGVWWYVSAGKLTAWVLQSDLDLQ
jgi:hypothetical protein